MHTTFHLHVCTPPRYTSIPLALPQQPDPALPHLSVVPLPSPRTIQIQHTTAMRQGASWTAAYHLQLTVAAGPDPSVAAWVPSASLLLSGPGGCLPGRRLPGGASSRYRGVGRRRRGRPCQQARHGVGRRCPAWGVHHPVSASGVRPSRCPVTGLVVQRVRPSAVQPSSVQPSGVQPSGVCPRPSGRVRLLPCSGGGGGDQGRAGRPTVATGTGGGPGGCQAVDGSSDGRGGRDAGDAAEVALVSGRWLADPGRRVGWGRRRPRLPAEQPGRPGRRSERPSRAAARWARVQAAAPGCRMPRGWRPRAGCATTVGGRRRAGRPGGRPRRGQGRCRRRGACGPSAAQADSECSQLAAGSALTCDDGWWACQDLNLGPHPYQVSRAKHCAQGRFPRSPLSVRGQGMRS
jgi:hypothetical protein